MEAIVTGGGTVIVVITRGRLLLNRSVVNSGRSKTDNRNLFN